ncbi:MAG TPA: hypothetical protein VFL16_03905 [Steroidobacteraceae bacterium]|nr:hypothetical protein [Steroidobacteraceae bacterium]
MIRSIPLAAVLLVCAASAIAKPNQNTAAGFKPPSGNYKVIVMRPDIAASMLTAGGGLEPREDWTNQAREHVLDALRAQQEMRGGQATITVTAGDDPALRDLMRLHEVVGQSILIHKYQPMQQLPTKNGALDWTLGKLATDFGKSAGYDYALFVFARDSFSSGGRVALQGIGMLGCIVGACILPQGGSQQAFASLVDLKTGNVVWFNFVASATGDIRTEAGAADLVNRLLEPMNDQPKAKKKKA